MLSNLWVVMPVYNEQDCLETVLGEWIPELRKHCSTFTFVALNDGSKDGSLALLQRLSQKYPELKVVDKANSGHGQSCIHGYKLAIENKAEWVFQMDSDGQCDPSFFGQIANAASNNKVVYGYRKSRDDGFRRMVISRIVSLFVLLSAGVWVRDGNVPYRLMHISSLQNIVSKVPSDFHLANILITVLQKKSFGIHWEDIHFRNRIGGVASVKAYSFAKHGFKLFRQLRSLSI